MACCLKAYNNITSVHATDSKKYPYPVNFSSTLSGQPERRLFCARQIVRRLRQVETRVAAFKEW